MGGQRIPGTARLLLFGRNHCEVDLKGSFYELVRRLGLLFMPNHVPLPTIDDLRAQLYRDPYIQAVEALCPHTVKQLPLRIINSSIDATYQHLQSIVDGSPGANLSATLHQLWFQSTALITQLLPRFRPAFSANHNDSAFRLLEYFEALIVEDTIHALIARHPTQSLVWLHDGFLVAPPPPSTCFGKSKRKFCPNISFISTNHGLSLLPLPLHATNTSRPSNILPVAVCLPLHAARLSNAPVSSMLLRAPFIFAPPRWKLSPSCALDVNDRSDHVASLSTCTTTCMPSPAPAILHGTETAPRGTLGSCFRSRRIVEVIV